MQVIRVFQGGGRFCGGKSASLYLGEQGEGCTHMGTVSWKPEAWLFGTVTFPSLCCVGREWCVLRLC